MKFLLDLGFDVKDVKQIEKNVPKLIKEQITNSKEVIILNINYLKKLPISNYVDAFTQYYDMFLMDNSAFCSIFSKYEKEDLIEKLENNISIIEHL